MIKLYSTYNKVKNVFTGPKLTYRFGLWKNDPGLPICKCPCLIRLCKFGEYRTSKESSIFNQKYEWTKKGKKNHRFLSKIFKPIYTLPIWLSFRIINRDMTWKTKWNDYCYEFPPQFTIVFFGLSLSFFLHNPTEDIHKDDDYWEAILWYLDKKDLDKVDEELGAWLDSDFKECERRLDKRFLKNENRIR